MFTTANDIMSRTDNFQNVAQISGTVVGNSTVLSWMVAGSAVG